MSTTKSSPDCYQFINLAGGSELPSEPCTTEIQPSDEFTLDRRTVTLIDTPGFDNSSTTDTDILRKIGPFLSAT